MSKEIDWSKAPQWADRVLAMGMAGAWAWANEHQYQYIGKINKEIFLYEEENTWNLSDGELVEMRHSVETWTGTGLPPVGTVCEAQNKDGNAWEECEVIAHSEISIGDVVVFKVGDKITYSSPRYFRPIRTQAQIEAEEREKALREIEELIVGYGYGKCAELIYDAGYRKTEAGK